MKYYIISGEASGDLHGSNLMKHLKEKDNNAEFRFWGGDLMLKESRNIVKHYKDLSFMGFWEVLINIRTIFKNIKFCKKDITQYQPSVIIFIDYPGFNLRIAKWAKAHNYKTFYYISPQIWAWKENRIHGIKQSIDQMFVILPFEKKFYEEKHHFLVHYMGHPLLDAISMRQKKDSLAFRKENNLPNKPIIALLPGSRKQEITKMLPIMLSVLENFESYCFVIAGSPSIDSSFYSNYIDNKNVFLIQNKTYDLLEQSTAALVTSGTATLETALFKVPQIVCYKSSKISYEIAKRIIKLKFISLVNIIANKEIVKELIQNDLNKKNLTKELHKILSKQDREQCIKKYNELQHLLGDGGASKKVAILMVSILENLK